MSKRLIKNVDWIISVPEIEDKPVFSNLFSIEFDEFYAADTKWMLSYNFKDEYFGVDLFSRSDQEDISCDAEITFIVMDWIDANGSKIIKHPANLEGWERLDNWSEPKLLSREELYNEQSRFVKDGELHLIVVIEEKLSEDEDEKKAQIKKKFKAITSVDDQGETTVLQSADGAKIKALKRVISEKSTVFKAMVEKSEKSKEIENIINFSGKVIEEVLRFMYYGKVESIEKVDMKLFEAAKVYLVDGLGDICLKSIESRVDLSTAFEVLEFANRHDQDDLFNTCSEIIYRFFNASGIEEKIKKLGHNIQTRLLIGWAKLSRTSSNVFCYVGYEPPEPNQYCESDELDDESDEPDDESNNE